MGEGYVALGWDATGGLREIGEDREDLKASVAAAYPGVTPRAVPAWAGQLLRFAFEVRVGDFVVRPEKADATLRFGRVVGDYRWEAEASAFRHLLTVAARPEAVGPLGAVESVGAGALRGRSPAEGTSAHITVSIARDR